LVYKTNHNVYDYKDGIDSTLHVSTFLRYLVDLCETVVCLPTNSIDVNPDTQNPFKE